MIHAEGTFGETFGDWQVNYGNLEELENFGAEHKLYYRGWFDGGGDWAAATYIYNPETTQRDEAMGDYDPSITLSTLKTMGSMGEALRYLERFSAPLPPLVIVP